MRRRSGFTITELLVAMALIVFIMSIIATAFSEGMRTFRALKGIGDMNQRMRIAASLLKDDLSAPHFGGDRRLSDANFWTVGPPDQGFFRIWQGTALTSATYVSEGKDIDYQIPSVRATDHILHFTSRRLGNDPSKFYHAAVPVLPPATLGGPPINTPLGATPLSPATAPQNYVYGNPNSRYQDAGTFTSQWAELAWFMRPNGFLANGTPLYTLYRRQRVVVPNPATGGTATVGGKTTTYNLNYPGIGAFGTLYNAAGQNNNYLGISCRQGGTNTTELIFNSPSDLTVPQFRFSMLPTSVGGFPQKATGTYPQGIAQGHYYYYAFQPSTSTTPNTTEELTSPSLQGADAVITDVISFSVQILTSAAPNFCDIQQTIAAGALNGTVPPPTNTLFNTGKTVGNTPVPYVFDTWSTVTDNTDTSNKVDYSLGNYSSPAALPKALQNKCAPLKIVITGIQIQLRVWDSKTEQTRQMTITVDM